MPVTGDNPIKDPADDALGRAELAVTFAEQMLSLDVDEGVVVGVLGPWGSGKTSFVNMARGRLGEAGVEILDFNPWMFSGADQLVSSFFVELSAQLKLRPGLADIGKDLDDYGEMFSGLGWLPIVGTWIERGRGATKILAKLLQRRKEGVGSRRRKLEDALRLLPRPIAVIVDDIDRLTTNEIRDIFKLVRLTANFPNVIYIVAFDRTRVETALSEEGIPGRDYLEKIIQVAVDLPSTPPVVLARRVLAALDTGLADVEEPGEVDENTWPDIFAEVIRPLVRNMRDVRRYVAAAHGTVQNLRGGVALADVLALEALRVFLPDVFATLRQSVEGLTTPAAPLGYSRQEPPHLKLQVEQVLHATGEHEDVVRAVIERLFPAAQRHIGGSNYGGDWSGRWLRERRVAHEDVLRLYLDRAPSEALEAFTNAEQAWHRFTDAAALETYLRSLDVARLQDVIASLEAFEDEFRIEHAAPALTVLLNLLPDLPERPRGMFEMDTRLVVGRVVYRLLRAIGDPARTTAVVREVLPELSTLSAKFELITAVGYREGAGHKLVREQDAADLEREWRSEVRLLCTQAARSDRSLGRFLREPELLRMLLVSQRDAPAGEPAIDVPAVPSATLAILKSASTEVRGQTMGNRAVRRSTRLAWDALVDIYGDEAMLHHRVDELLATPPDGEQEFMALLRRYRDGWRPRDLGMDDDDDD